MHAYAALLQEITRTPTRVIFTSLSLALARCSRDAAKQTWPLCRKTGRLANRREVLTYSLVRPACVLDLSGK